jgi:hypothetical protein
MCPFEMNIFQIRVLLSFASLFLKDKKGKVIPVTNRGDPLGCETSRLQ